MMQYTKAGVITEQEARQLEQSLQDARSGRLGAFTVMMQTDSDIQEEIKHDPLYASDSLAELREALEAHRRVTDLMETAVSRLERMRG
ncbi:hypothetical protein [Marinobacter sp. tcs-11]|uniref:hypothetical protein n=1 Tax=Marinobacter sp. tcs-11 TaxID=1742860 RepID=UPI002580AE19|nr:hypothetical protein [Marinobacter sp. tcs-11]MEC9040439.1 hypothetical protein [Pseudomonadota bacterium]|tara:strand:+ start:2999 stop:3262 length:264 start_codon:yes stop_codon:yes gene_type:complete